MSAIRPLLGKGRVRARNARGDPFETASWLDDGLTFDHRWLSCGDAELAWTAPHHLVVLTERGATSHTGVRVGGERTFEGRDRPGALSFIPAGADRLCAYRNVDLVYTALWIDPALQSRLRGFEDLAIPPPMVNRADVVISALLESLRDEVAANHRPQTAYVEHLLAVVLSRLARLDGTVSTTDARSAPLNRPALNRVQDYIEANIGSDIALTDLAGLLDMPVDSFARRFRAATGLAPYAYVIERRVRHAETLLKTTREEIAVIALTLGFSSQSHLTTTFRRVVGTTPRAYRAQFSPEI